MTSAAENLTIGKWVRVPYKKAATKKHKELEVGIVNCQWGGFLSKIPLSFGLLGSPPLPYF